MCTSIIYSSNNHYFGRNLDLEITFGQKVTITPRNYEFDFRKMPKMTNHYAIIGMAMIADNYPLYFDGANEQGLGMAGLNYAGIATYLPENPDKDNVAQFEFIPYILGQCSTVEEAKKLIAKMNMVDINFSEKMVASSLHWLIADKTGASITVEPDADGLHYYDNPVGVLTNNPQFPKQMMNLANYASVSSAQPKNTFSPNVDLDMYSRGMGTHFLPGGIDSESRFVRVAFTLQHAPKGKDEIEDITNYFHTIHSVEQQKGLDEVSPDTFEYTIYSDGINLEKGIFYYTNYDNNQINAIDMHKVDLDGKDLVSYEVIEKQNINFQN